MSWFSIVEQLKQSPRETAPRSSVPSWQHPQLFVPNAIAARAICNQGCHGSWIFARLSKKQWRLTRGAAGCNVCAMLQPKANDAFVAFFARRHQWGVSVSIGRVGVGVMLQKQPAVGFEPFIGGQVAGGKSLLVEFVNGNAAHAKDKAQRIDPGIDRGRVKQRLSFVCMQRRIWLELFEERIQSCRGRVPGRLLKFEAPVGHGMATRCFVGVLWAGGVVAHGVLNSACVW